MSPELRYNDPPTYNAGNTRLVVDENLNVVQDFATLGGKGSIVTSEICNTQDHCNKDAQMRFPASAWSSGKITTGRARLLARTWRATAGVRNDQPPHAPYLRDVCGWGVRGQGQPAARGPLGGIGRG